MKIAIYDVYLKRIDGRIMHFDILVPNDMSDADTIVNFGKSYLESKKIKTEELQVNACQFCHVDEASQETIANIIKKGYHIIELENCQ